MAKGFREQDYDLALDARVQPKPHVDSQGKEGTIGGNQNVWFMPRGLSLRGEMRMELVRSLSIPGAIAQVGGVIPGQRILIDTKSKHAKIIDRLTLPENQGIVDQLKRLAETEQYYTSRFGQLAPDVDFDIVDEEWPKWMYYCRRMVDHGTLMLVRGGDKLPSLDDCRKLGPIVLNNASGLTPKDTNNPFNVLKPPKPELAGAK